MGHDGTGRAASVGDAGAVWCGEQDGSWLRVVCWGKPSLGMKLGKTCCRAPGGCSALPRQVGASPRHPPTGAKTASACISRGWGGQCRGSRYHLALLLQEKEIMKELMENGPVQGRELVWTPQLCTPKLGAAMGGSTWWVGEATLPGAGICCGSQDPPGCSA